MVEGWSLCFCLLGKSLCVSWGKGRGGGIPRARRNKDLKGAERMERKGGWLDQASMSQAKAAGGGEMRRREELEAQEQGPVGLAPSSPH